MSRSYMAPDGSSIMIHISESIDKPERNPHTWNSLPIDSWIEVMAKLTYPDIISAYGSSVWLRAQYDENYVWKGIVLRKHPKIMHYIDIARRILPGWDIVSWETVDRDLWHMGLSYAENQRLYDVHTEESEDMTNKMEIFRGEAFQCVPSQKKAQHPGKLITPNLFNAKRPNLNILKYTIRSYPMEEDEKTLRGMSLYDIPPILLVADAEIDKRFSLVRSGFQMYFFAEEAGLEIVTPIIAKYTPIEDRVEYLEHCIQDERGITTSEDLEILLSTLNVGGELAVSAIIVASLSIYHGPLLLQAYITKHGIYKNSAAYIDDIYEIIKGDGFWKDIREASQIDRERAIKMSENIVGSLEPLFVCGCIKREDVTRFIGVLAHFLSNRVFKTLQRVCKSFNLTKREVNTINASIQTMRSDRSICRR